MKVTPAARAGEVWRPWTIWLPSVLAFLWSGLLIVADDFASLMGSWDTPPSVGWAGLRPRGSDIPCWLRPVSSLS